MTGLTTGTTYRFTVRALNANGAGPESAQSNAVTPQGAVAPSAPTGVTAQPATQSARVTWETPASDGDSRTSSDWYDSEDRSGFDGRVNWCRESAAVGDDARPASYGFSRIGASAWNGTSRL